MSNALTPKFKEAILQAYLAGAAVKAIMVDADDHPDNVADDYLNDISEVGAIVATSPTLTTKTFANGVFRSDSITIAGVSGDQTERLYLYVDTGTPSTSLLISLANCTFIPNGSGVIILCPAGGWFAL